MNVPDLTGKTPVNSKIETEDRNMREENSKKNCMMKTLEPATTLIDEEKFIRILIELPGIAEEKIRIDLDKNSVIIRASDTVKQFKKTIRIPIDARFSKKRFSDGVLELILEKTIPGQILIPADKCESGFNMSWFIVSKFVSKTEF